MPRPGRERERDGVLRGWREASSLGLPEGQDRCLLAEARKKLWLMEQMESSGKCDHKARPCAPKPPRASNPRVTVSTALSMLCVCLSDCLSSHSCHTARRVSDTQGNCLTLVMDCCDWQRITQSPLTSGSFEVWLQVDL